jgi:hypothetical protein
MYKPENCVGNLGKVKQLSAAVKAPPTPPCQGEKTGLPFLSESCDKQVRKARRCIGLSLEQLETRCLPAGGLTLNQCFVTQLYQDVLTRTPDSAGLAYWSASLDQGMTRTEVAGQLTQSSEALSQVLDSLYEAYFGRNSDEGGKAVFLPLLASGEESLVQARLLGSSEYLSAHDAGHLTDYLSHLYVDVLGRPADSVAESYFTASRFAGDRTAIALAVKCSPEAIQRLVQQDYERFLEREPDSVGVAYWAGAFSKGANAQALVQSILGSQEYFDSPHANNDVVETTARTPVVFNVAANDTRLFGRSYEVALLQNPTNGSAAVREDGSIIYSPSAGFTGVDILAYRLQTAAGTSSLGIVTITVNPPAS